MNMAKFLDYWIEKNCRTSEVYGDAISESLRELVETFINQRHSGGSGHSTLFALVKFMEDYEHQEP